LVGLELEVLFGACKNLQAPFLFLAFCKLLFLFRFKQFGEAMIKSVSIQNFESHEDTTIHFGEGMNLIVGLSNSGKSAIIRALACVVNNRWEKSMVRTGYEFCRVRVETERGWVECERGEKVNRWRCKEGNNDIQEYKSVGSGVPDLATKILGMGERERSRHKGIAQFSVSVGKALYVV